VKQELALYAPPWPPTGRILAETGVTRCRLLAAGGFLTLGHPAHTHGNVQTMHNGTYRILHDVLSRAGFFADVAGKSIPFIVKRFMEVESRSRTIRVHAHRIVAELEIMSSQGSPLWPPVNGFLVQP
jgi:hypothetical protein